MLKTKDEKGGIPPKPAPEARTTIRKIRAKERAHEQKRASADPALHESS